MGSNVEILNDYENRFPQLMQDIYVDLRKHPLGGEEARAMVGRLNNAIDFSMQAFLALPDKYSGMDLTTRRNQMLSKIVECYAEIVRLTPANISYDQASVDDVMETRSPDQFFDGDKQQHL